MKHWWIWGYWISPLMYSLNAISTNEFLGDKWSHVSNFLLLPRMEGTEVEGDEEDNIEISYIYIYIAV